jgi:transposase
VAGLDDTTPGCGAAGGKNHVPAAVTDRCSLFFPGARTLESFREFGILPTFAGLVFSDWYQNYFRDGWQRVTGHQACLAHLIRDYEDAAECWTDTIWPVQAQQALRGLVCTWHAAASAASPRSCRRIRDR